MIFQDRAEAGQKLAKELEKYRGEDLRIIALPRGGVPVGDEVARTLNAPLDIVIVRKLGYPKSPELGFGAIAPSVLVLNQDMLQDYPLSSEEIEKVRTNEEVELHRRIDEYLDGAVDYDLKNKTVIVVDDGIATGITTRAAIAFIKTFEPKRIVVATPVCSPDSLREIKKEVYKVVCLNAPVNFSAVAQWYVDFPQVTDVEVKDVLAKYRSKVTA